MKNIYKVVIDSEAFLESIFDNALATLDNEHGDVDLNSMNVKSIVINKDGTVEVTYDRKHEDCIDKLTFNDADVQVTCKKCEAVIDLKIVELDVPVKKADIFCPVCSTQHVKKKYK